MRNRNPKDVCQPAEFEGGHLPLPCLDPNDRGTVNAQAGGELRLTQTMREPNIPDTLAYFSPAFYCPHLCDSRTLVVSASPLCPASGGGDRHGHSAGAAGRRLRAVGDRPASPRCDVSDLKDPNGAADLDY